MAENRVAIAPSILTADFGALRDQIRLVAPHVDWFHLDVMDGHYVDNITFGPTVVEVVREACDLPLHVHLMISNPERYVDWFVRSGAARVSFHAEVVDDPAAVIETIRESGAGAGLAVHPDVEVETVRKYLDRLAVVLMMTVRPGFGGQAFIPEVVPKIAHARRMVEEAASMADIEVDGGVNLRTVRHVVEAGADIVVAGSAIYDGQDPVGAATRLRAELDALGRPG